MDFTICNFCAKLPDGRQYLISIEEDAVGGIVSILAVIKVKAYGEWRYHDHAVSCSRIWKEAFYQALLTLENKHDITLIKLKIDGIEI